MFWAESSQCNSPLFNRVAGQVEVPAGQVNFRSSLPCWASNVLEPMLYPVQSISVVPVNWLIKDLTIFTSNFDDQFQFLKTNCFFGYLHMIKRHTFCFSYIYIYVQKYILSVFILLFLHCFCWYYPEISWKMHYTWCMMHMGTDQCAWKTPPNKYWSSIPL